MNQIKDKRLQWLFKRVFNSVLIGNSEWNGFLSESKNIRICMRFMDESSHNRLYFFFTAKTKEEIGREKKIRKKSKTFFPNILRVSLTLNESTLEKGIMFKRKVTEKIDETNIMSALIYQEISPNFLDQFSLLVNKVFIPLVHNNVNQRGWPKVVSDDICTQINQFSSSLSLFQGKIEGKTILQIPNVRDSSSLNKNAIHSLESVVIEWINEVMKVVENEPEKILDQYEEKNEFLGPMFEYEFWIQKYKNLKNLKNQLDNIQIKKVIMVLREHKSTYVNEFDKIIPILERSLKECESINDHMKILKDYFELLEKPTGKYAVEIEKNYYKIFKPFLVQIEMFWDKVYPNYSQIKIISLFREICNDVMKKIVEFINPSTIFLISLEEGKEKLINAMKQCKCFKSEFSELQKKVNEKYQKKKEEEKEMEMEKEKEKDEKDEKDEEEGEKKKKKKVFYMSKQWEFKEEIIFKRLNSFCDRLSEMLDIIKSFEDYDKLYCVKLGGIKGSFFAGIIEQIHMDFNVAKSKIQAIQYDCFNFTNDQFKLDYFEFQKCMQDFDKKMCFVISKGFDVCANLKTGFIFLKAFRSQRKREKINVEIREKYYLLFQRFDRDLDRVLHIFITHKDNPPNIFNLPELPGALTWCHSLINRIQYPHEQFKEVKEMFNSEKKKDLNLVDEKYLKIIKILKEHVESIYDEWVNEIDGIIAESLEDCIWKKNEDEFVEINFDTSLSDCMKEVKHLQILNMKVPESAMKIYKRKDEFKQLNMDLQDLVEKYNAVSKSTNEFEASIIQKMVNELEERVAPAFEEINWNSKEKVHSFINKQGKHIQSLYDTLNVIRGNEKIIKKILSSWQNLARVITNEISTELIEDVSISDEIMDKEAFPKFLTLATFWRNPNNANYVKYKSTGHKIFSLWKKKTSLIIENVSTVLEHGSKIHEIVRDSLKKVELNVEISEWTKYVGHLDNIVRKEMRLTVIECLKHLMKKIMTMRKAVNQEGFITSSKIKEQRECSLLEVKLKLINGEITFSPSFSEVRTIVTNWINNISLICKKIPNLSKENVTPFEKILEEKEILELKQQIHELTEETLERMREKRGLFMKYSFLWEENIQESIDRLYSELDDVDDIDVDNSLSEIGGSVSGDENLNDDDEEEEGEYFHDNMIEMKEEEKEKEKEKERGNIEGIQDNDIDSNAPNQENLSNLSTGFQEKNAKKISPLALGMNKKKKKKTLFSIPVEEFASQVEDFAKLFMEVGKFEKMHSFGWIICDVTPLLDELSSLSMKWKYKYLLHLQESVNFSLKEVEDFVGDCKSTLEIEINEHNRRNVKIALIKLSEISGREEFRYSTTKTKKIEHYFSPLHEVSILLNKHEMSLEKETLKRVDNVPFLWKNLMKAYYYTRDKLSKLPMYGSENELSDIDTNVDQFFKLRPVVINGCDMVGKSVVIHRLQMLFPDLFTIPKMYTTRKMNFNEINGREYHFITKDEFSKMMFNNEFVTVEEVNNSQYGVHKKEVEMIVKKKMFCTLEMDLINSKVNKKNDKECLYIYITMKNSEKYKNIIRENKKDLLLDDEDIDEELEKKIDLMNHNMIYETKEAEIIFDFVVDNDGSIDDCCKKIFEILKEENLGLDQNFDFEEVLIALEKEQKEEDGEEEK